MVNKIIQICFIFLLFSCSKSQNPKHICKDCGTFDLATVTFNESILDLSAKTEVWKEPVVDQNNIEVKFQDTSGKKSGLFITHFSNQKNKTLGKKPFNYENKFFFKNLSILADSNNKIYALDATIFHDGEMAEIDNFIEYLKKKYKNFKITQNKMAGALTVYQWRADDKIIQIVKDNELGYEERTINGKTEKLKSTYFKFTIYSSSFIKSSLEKLVVNNKDFIIFNEKHYYKF